MKRKTFNQCFLIVSLLGPLFSCGGVGVKPSADGIPSAAIPVPVEEDDVVIEPKEPALTSEQAYEQSVFPLVKTYCAGCHSSAIAPFFAQSEDVKASHDTTLETQKVDLESPALSRLYQRLANENHQCWGDCKNNAAEMLKAIEQWAGSIKKIPVEEEILLNQTTKLLLKDVVDSQAEFSIPTLLIEAESATLSPNGFVVGNDASRSDGKYIGIEEAGQPIADILDPNIAKAEYKFTVTVAGKYYFWGLVNAPDATSDSFFIAMNGATPRRWNIATGNLETWKWELARAEDAQVMEFDLAVGEHTLVLFEREDGTKIDKFAITMSTDFSEETSQSVKILRYDISKLAGLANVYFTIEVKTFNDDSYLFRNPSIVTSSGQFKVKKIDLLLNDQVNPNNATYQLVDEVVSADQGLLSSAAMVVLMDKGVDKDQFAFKFEEFAIVK